MYTFLILKCEFISVPSHLYMPEKNSEQSAAGETLWEQEYRDVSLLVSLSLAL